MKNKRKQIILLVCGIITMLIIFLIVPNLFIDLDKEKAKEIIMMKTHEVLNINENEEKPFILTIYDGLIIEVKDISKMKDECKVTCEISNYDVHEALDNIELSATEISLIDFNQIAADTLSQSKRITRIEEICIIKEDGDFIVKLTEDNIDALSGGLISYFNELIEKGE